MKKDIVIVERIYDATVDRVWAALTTPEQMKQWYFDIPGFKAEVGYECRYVGGSAGFQKIHLFRVTEVVKESKLSYSWRYEGYPGDSLVTFSLAAEGDKTHLTITHTGLANIADELHNRGIGFQAGWTQLSGQLGDFLAGK